METTEGSCAMLGKGETQERIVSEREEGGSCDKGQRWKRTDIAISSLPRQDFVFVSSSAEIIVGRLCILEMGQKEAKPCENNAGSPQHITICLVTV